jgi:hypothetical protein
MRIAVVLVAFRAQRSLNIRDLARRIEQSSPKQPG